MTEALDLSAAETATPPQRRGVVACALARPSGSDHRKMFRWPRCDGVALTVTLALGAPLWPVMSVKAAALITLKVEAAHGLLGFHHSALSRFIAAHMSDAGLAGWRFEPAEGDASARDRVEWTFRLNPYAGGEVRNFVRGPASEQSFGVHRPVTIEARLYLNGEYETLVETQAVIQGGSNDPDLAAAVASTTANLLSPLGAYRNIETGRAAPHAR